MTDEKITWEFVRQEKRKSFNRGYWTGAVVAIICLIILGLLSCSTTLVATECVIRAPIAIVDGEYYTSIEIVETGKRLTWHTLEELGEPGDTATVYMRET